MIRDRATAGVAVVLVAAGGLILWSSWMHRTELAAELDSTTRAVDVLHAQVETLGGEPVVEVERQEDGGIEIVEGPPGPAGPPGPRGRPGVDGDDGDDGADGSDGADGADGSDGARGPAGADGDPGAGGDRGPTGPAGPAGPAGERGRTGDTGPVGPPGVDGVDGDPPESWTFTWRGQTWTCVDETGDLHYECSPTDPDG